MAKRQKRVSTVVRRKNNRTETKMDALMAPRIVKHGPSLGGSMGGSRERRRAVQVVDRAHAHAISLQRGVESLRLYEVNKVRLAILANPDTSVELRLVTRAALEGRNVTFSGGPEQW